MRRFFSLRSSSSSNPAPPASIKNKEKEHLDALRENDVKTSAWGKAHDVSQTPEDSVLKPLNRFLESEDSSNPHLRRSLSFSSPAIYRGFDEEHLDSLNDHSRSPCSCSDAQHRNCPLHCRSLIPERYTRTKRSKQPVVRISHAVEKLDSPSSSSACQCSTGNSPHSSPIPLRCRPTRLTQFSNKDKTLDLYIDGEHQVIKSNKDSQGNTSHTRNGHLAQNSALPSSERPPRAQSTAPSSPTCSKENMRTYSFREVKDNQRHCSTGEWTRDDYRSASPQKYTEQTIEKSSHALPRKFTIDSRGYDSETTTTIEDIYENSSDVHPTSNSSGIAQKCSSNLILPYKNLNGYCSEDFHRQSCFTGKGSMEGVENDMSISSWLQEQDTDEDLNRKVRELEERFMLLSEDPEPEKLWNKSLSMASLLQQISNITEDRRYMASELSSQIKCRLAERCFARERFKQSKVELDTRVRRLEKEKNELQLSLEKELDRRSNDWALKLGKFQTEEQRLRERVRELAEQNVSLQREVFSLRGNEVESRNRIMNSELKLNDLTASIEEGRAENHNLHQTLSELQERYNGVKEDRDSIRRSYKEKEIEGKELHKLVVRLQRICTEQDKTISGLRQGFIKEIGKDSIEQGDGRSRLQMEQLRLTGVEQMLRRELASCQLELESLRNENVCLLDRLQGTGSRYGFSSLRLDQELRARIDCLQSQCLSLLDDNSHFCGELLELIKGKKYEYCQEANSDPDGYSIIEFTLKYQSLRRGIGNLRRSLQTLSVIVEEKSNSEVLECQSQTTEAGSSRQWKGQASEDEVELELKAEAILTKVLREKLCSRELEIEQLQEDLACSMRGRDVLQTEIQRLQDELSCMTHKKKDMELQMLKKEESINQLQHDLQECMKELTATRSILMKVSEERDRIWEEVKQLRENNMLMDCEVKSLRKKIEGLEEDILYKEGQISILKDSLGNKPFDIIYSPKSMEEFTHAEL